MPPKLGIISPCYNEELLIKDSGQKFLGVLDDLVRKSKIDPESFICFINDGSTDSTWTLIEQIHKSDNRIKALKLSRNFGQENAVLAGLFYAKEKADCFITINSDLQDDLLIIEKFIDGFKEGNDVIYGVKKNSRKDSWYKRYGTSVFNSIIKLLGISNNSDFRFASKKAINALSEFDEVNIFLSGMFPLIGFKTKEISYEIHERIAGESKYSLRMLLELAWNGITSFSVVPLRLIVFGGFIISFFSMVVFVLILMNIISNSALSWILFSIFFVGGIQMIEIGILGEYIGKIYKETKNRPRFIKDTELW